MAASPITPNQLQILRSLLAKKGWSEAYFAWKTRRTVEDLTTSQARDWISRLTRETKGKPRATTLLEPPEPPLAFPPRPKAAAEMPVAAAAAEASPAPPHADIEAAAATMMTQLGLVGEPHRQTIIRILEQVGVQAGFAAVMLALASPDQSSRLTVLEQWVVCCRQLTLPGSTTAHQPPEPTR